jgi:alkaline phosphatase D
MTLDRRQLLEGLAALGALGLGAAGARSAGAQDFATLAGVLLVPVGPQLDPGRPLVRIGIGSCFNQEKDGALLGTALRTKPDLFLFMGDNVYGDTRSPDLDELLAAYAGALVRPDYRRFRQAVPITAVWDDHDFGLNDAGATYAYKEKSRPLFFDFWGVPADSPRRRTNGIFDAFVTGPSGARVQVILLDTRTFRDDWTDTDAKGEPGRERYVEQRDPARTILGAAQWAWLETELAQPADIRIVVTSYQLLADGHGWERWGLFPLERKRFYDLVAKTDAKGIVLVSGDRHRAGIYRETRDLPYPLHELTASAINMGWSPETDPGEEPGPNRIGPTFRRNNIGLITLDWDRRTIAFEIFDGQDRIVLRHAFRMNDLSA